MRPLTATDSKVQLARACQWLAAFTRNQSRAWRRLGWATLAAIFLWATLWVLTHAPRGLYDPRMHAAELARQHELEAASATPTPAPTPAPTPPVPRAELVVPRVERALPVKGATYLATLSDGRTVRTRWLGPWHPEIRADQLQLGDQYSFAGHSWVWWTPVSGGPATWIDP